MEQSPEESQVLKLGQSNDWQGTGTFPLFSLSQSCGKPFHFVFGLIEEKKIEKAHAQNEYILIFCSE